MLLGQEPLDSKASVTIRQWIEAGAPDWETTPKPRRRFITTEEMIKAIYVHVESLTTFDRSFARYFILTHLYNVGTRDDANFYAESPPQNPFSDTKGTNITSVVSNFTGFRNSRVLRGGSWSTGTRGVQ